MALDNNSIFEIEQTTPKNNITVDNVNVHKVNSQNKLDISPKTLLGYYISAFESFFKENNREININPSYQENFIPNNTTPVLLVNRGSVAPAILATPGDTFKHMPVGINGINGINLNETKGASFLLNQQMTLKLFSSNRAELEILGYMVFKILLALSDDVLNEVFQDIIRINPPSMTPIQPIPKSSDYYFIEMEWEIMFKECSILIFKEKLLKYSRLIVQDHQAKDEME